MRESTKQLGLRIPADQYNKLQDYAKSQNKSMTELIIRIFDDFLDASTPGLCQFCHTLNSLDASYCQKCGEPLTEEAKKESDRLKEYYNNEDVLIRIVEKMLEKKGFEIVKKE
ncbi:MAG: zinc ribbon domain-containing protein [Methanospirillum sp.]|uniref:zinc ribbon domain-containing protein n=1 Tax=Methanospirillum sp. TaxID=45200 RepID=UPI00236CEA4D|nr:zinc ribbon domain-containing protein [Methanospirillum sp.]MDD1729825.1 zinc ribbon domain-containing protein [Methanospirillum sp.]